MASRDYQVQGGVLHVHDGGWADWIPAGEPRGRVRLRVSPDRQGRRTITDVRISDPAGVAAGLLRRIPVGALEDVLNAPREDAPREDALVIPATVAAVASVPGVVVTVEVDPAAFYRQVASDYTAAAAVTRHPARKLADDRGVSERTVSRWLAEVRRRGLLPPSRRQRGAS